MISAKERPLCRKAIDEGCLTPNLVNGIWDGFSARDSGGQRTSLSGGMKKTDAAKDCRRALARCKPAYALNAAPIILLGSNEAVDELLIF